jgi:hypothetical protein
MWVDQHVKRSSTKANYWRVISGPYAAFQKSFSASLLPARQGDVELFMMTRLIDDNMDSTTVEMEVRAISDWHDYFAHSLNVPLFNPCKSPSMRQLLPVVLNNYKKESKAKLGLSVAELTAMFSVAFAYPNLAGGGLAPSARRVLHARLVLLFLYLGMLRQNAATHLVVCYSIHPVTQAITWLPGSDVRVEVDPDTAHPYIAINVDCDKNVNARKVREAYIPHEVVALGIRPVEILEHYVREVRPPSGGFLLACPTGKRSFSAKAFSKCASVVKMAYRAAFPDGAKAKQLGSHSGRLSLAQQLWTDGHCRRVIADIGGWFMKRDAVDLYFETQRQVILRAVRYIGTKLGFS